MYSLNSAGKGGRRTAATETPTTASSPPISPRRTLPHVGRGRPVFNESMFDDPPSPDRLRADSRQARKGSIIDKHSSQLTISSGSSWDHSTEDLSLPISRRSSQRSTSSNAPLPQDRPDSLMVFGKSIFSRKGKGRRDISELNLSANALYPPGIATDPMPTPKEQRSMAALFSRRKSMKGTETMPAQQKKVQISEPYNFQHLTHTLKDNLPNLERTTRMDLVSEFSCIRAGQKPHGSLKGIQADDIQYERLSTELYVEGFEPELDEAQLRQDFPNTPSNRGSYLPRIRPISSLEDTLLAPFTPPAASAPAASAPVPAPAPAWVPGRMTTRLDDFELLPSADPDRLAPLPGPPRRQSEPHIHMTSRHTASPDPSCGVTALDDTAWPLSANTMASLPELPEEEEAHASPREPPSRPARKRSSLRGSVSVPALHQFSMSQARPAQVKPQRAPSDASDTLGDFNLVKIQQLPARKPSVAPGQMTGESVSDNWEDDIDYCYDHAAEADCDFAWERPSGETQREIKWEEQPAVDYRISSINSPGCFSPDTLSPRTSQFPSILSPVPQGPNTTQPRSVAPPTATVPVKSNFSLPQRAHNRALSRSDSFRERARGLSVSPTFFISTENPQQSPEDDRRDEPVPYDDDDSTDDDEDFLTHLPTSGSSSHLDKKAMLLHTRSSASTDLSAYSEHSLSSSRHKSNASINTALTGWTTNSTCNSLDGSQANCETSQTTSQPAIAVNDEELTLMVNPYEDSKVLSTESSRPTSRDRSSHERHKSDADLLSKACAAAASASASASIPPDTKEVPPKSRRRARTTSRSHNNSPSLALFPHVPSGTRRP